MTRLSTSRPNRSVPNGAAPVGRASMRSKFCSSGGRGASRSAKSAMTTIISATTAPTTTTVLRVTRRRLFVAASATGSLGGPGGECQGIPAGSGSPAEGTGRQAPHEEFAHDEGEDQYRQHDQRAAGGDLSPFPALVVHEVHDRDRGRHRLGAGEDQREEEVVPRVQEAQDGGGGQARR